MVIWDIVISAFVIACVALAVYVLYNDKRNGKNCCGCNGGCHCCSGGCSSEPQILSIEDEKD